MFSHEFGLRQAEPGDCSGEAIPVPISNTEVKLSSAENTEGAAPRQDRSSPGSLASWGIFSPRLSGACSAILRTWNRSSLARARGSSTTQAQLSPVAHVFQAVAAPILRVESSPTRSVSDAVSPARPVRFVMRVRRRSAHSPQPLRQVNLLAMPHFSMVMSPCSRAPVAPGDASSLSPHSQRSLLLVAGHSRARWGQPSIR